MQDTPLELGGTCILRGCHNLMGIGSTANQQAGNGEGRVEESAFGTTTESGFVGAFWIHFGSVLGALLGSENGSVCAQMRHSSPSPSLVTASKT
jgi:hypothetical protein